jgi:hypothetical protein
VAEDILAAVTGQSGDAAEQAVKEIFHQWRQESEAAGTPTTAEEFARHLAAIGIDPALAAVVSAPAAASPRPEDLTPQPAPPPSGGTPFVEEVMRRMFPPQRQLGEWELAFFREHGRLPTEVDVADREWSERFARTTGRPPTRAEWEAHYYISRGLPVQKNVRWAVGGVLKAGVEPIPETRGIPEFAPGWPAMGREMSRQLSVELAQRMRPGEIATTEDIIRAFESMRKKQEAALQLIDIAEEHAKALARLYNVAPPLFGTLVREVALKFASVPPEQRAETLRRAMLLADAVAGRSRVTLQQFKELMDYFKYPMPAGVRVSGVATGRTTTTTTPTTALTITTTAPATGLTTTTATTDQTTITTTTQVLQSPNDVTLDLPIRLPDKTGNPREVSLREFLSRLYAGVLKEDPGNVARAVDNLFNSDAEFRKTIQNYVFDAAKGNMETRALAARLGYLSGVVQDQLKRLPPLSSTDQGPEGSGPGTQADVLTEARNYYSTLMAREFPEMNRALRESLFFAVSGHPEVQEAIAASEPWRAGTIAYNLVRDILPQNRFILALAPQDLVRLAQLDRDRIPFEGLQEFVQRAFPYGWGGVAPG